MKKEENLGEYFKNYLYNKALNQISLKTELLILLLHYKVYRETYKFLKISQWWSKEQLEDYQLHQLNKLLCHVYENVPYYRKIFDNLGLKPKDISTFKDLQKLPFQTREIVRNNINDLKARNYPEYKFGYTTTGGTNGIPLGLYEERSVSFIKEFAYIQIAFDRIDCTFKDKFVMLRGAVIPYADKGKFWMYSLFGRCLFLSSYHMNQENLPKYIEKIRKFKPKFITTYPSTITILARFMKKNNLKPFPSLKAIICGAENLYDWQRDLLENFFQCRVFESYGHSEQAVHAAACEKSNYFHIFPEYGIFELIDKNGKSVNKENATGEIVATGFKNYIFPFIRYKTGDFGVYTNQKCSCGRNYPLLKKIEGRRLQEFIITKNNRPIPLTAMNMHSDVFDNVKQLQFYQDKKSEVILKIVKADSFTEKDTENIRQELSKKLGNDIDLIIQSVNEIPRTTRGKYNFIIQKLPIKFENL